MTPNSEPDRGQLHEVRVIEELLSHGAQIECSYSGGQTRRRFVSALALDLLLDREGLVQLTEPLADLHRRGLWP